jgi:DNA-binding MarR family transcriptional regulator
MGDDGVPQPSRLPGALVRDLRVVMEELESVLGRADESGASGIAVSASQLRVLLALERTSGLNLRELGEAVGSAPSALSRLCARLEAMGFVQRLPSAQSGREIELQLTPHASGYLQELRARRERALALVLESVSPAGIKALGAGLPALHVALAGHAEARASGADEDWAPRSA